MPFPRLYLWLMMSSMSKTTHRLTVSWDNGDVLHVQKRLRWDCVWRCAKIAYKFISNTYLQYHNLAAVFPDFSCCCFHLSMSHCLSLPCSNCSGVVITAVIPELKGYWECVASASERNASRGVELIVLESSALHCPEDRVINNQEEFRLECTCTMIGIWNEMC